MDKMVFILGPWFSDLAAHQNLQELLEECAHATVQTRTAVPHSHRDFKGSGVTLARSWSENPELGPRDQ